MKLITFVGVSGGRDPDAVALVLCTYEKPVFSARCPMLVPEGTGASSGKGISLKTFFAILVDPQ